MLHTTSTCTTTPLSPLSPHTKATLEKHGIRKSTLYTGTPVTVRQKKDIGCLTGEFYWHVGSCKKKLVCLDYVLAVLK